MVNAKFFEVTSAYQKACESLDEKESRIQKEKLCMSIMTDVSCYSELMIKCTLSGIEPNDKTLLSLMQRIEADNVWRLITNEEICFINEKGEKVGIDEVHGSVRVCESSIKSLKGSPRSVFGSFRCDYCNNITSLEFAPSYVNIDFSCSFCNGLTSLIGAPSDVGMDFNCMSCENLESLDGFPSTVGNVVKLCNCKRLVNLDGMKNAKLTRQFNPYIDCCGCDSLTSIDGAIGTGVKSIRVDGCPNLKVDAEEFKRHEIEVIGRN